MQQNTILITYAINNLKTHHIMKTLTKALLTVLLCVVVAPSFCMRASAQLYDNVDTTLWPWAREANYYYWDRHWIDSVMYHPCVTGIPIPGVHPTGGGGEASSIDYKPIVGRKYYTDTALRIIGVAVIFDAPKDTVGVYNGYTWYKKDYIQEYLHILDGNDSMNHELRRVSFSIWDTAKAICELKYGRYESWQDAISYYGKLVEAYFDSAIIVRDSFYAARTEMNRDLDTCYAYGPGGESFQRYAICRNPFGTWSLRVTLAHGCSTDGIYDCGSICRARNTVINKKYGYYYYNYVDSARADSCKKACYSCWQRDSAAVSIAYFKGLLNDHVWTCVFPIIDTTFVDTNKRPPLPPNPPQQSCDRVGNIQFYNTDDGMVSLTWLRGNHQAWEVSYGPAGTPPDSATIETVYSPFWTKFNLDTIWYDLYVRGICDSSSSSDWSDCFHFKPNASGNDNAIAQPDPANINILPNPSEGKVAVNAEAVILSIDLFNLSGVRLDSFEVNATQAHLDLSLLPRGTYLLLVHTDMGSSVQKLVLM